MNAYVLSEDADLDLNEIWEYIAPLRRELRQRSLRLHSDAEQRKSLGRYQTAANSFFLLFSSELPQSTTGPTR